MQKIIIGRNRLMIYLHRINSMRLKKKKKHCRMQLLKCKQHIQMNIECLFVVFRCSWTCVLINCITKLYKYIDWTFSSCRIRIVNSKLLFLFSSMIYMVRQLKIPYEFCNTVYPDCVTRQLKSIHHFQIPLFHYR